jgi:SAM-dependent methyltransferase
MHPRFGEVLHHNFTAMNNQNSNNNEQIPTIHDFDLNLICEYYLSLDRQGPGSPAITLKALSFIEGLTADSRIADLGCGTGGQTMTLAKATAGHITGIDIFPKFIDRFNEQAREMGVSDRTQGIVGSMDALPFAPQSLDLIWCEGAIYNLGFERGLSCFRDFLKPGGYVALTENTWFTDEHPAEVEEFWNAAYPEIDTIPAKIAAMQRAGYEFVAAFKVPEQCWHDFYASQDVANRIFREKHAGNPAAEALLAGEAFERALYEKYPEPWGYVFYICRKK